MKSKPLTIGEYEFASQKAATAFVSNLLNATVLHSTVPEPDHSFLCALVRLHPRADEKIGSGISHFTVEPNKGGTRCFYLVRTDGTHTDFSSGKCIRGKE